MTRTYAEVNGLNHTELREAVRMGYHNWSGLTEAAKANVGPRLLAMEERLRRLDATVATIRRVGRAVSRLEVVD